MHVCYWILLENVCLGNAMVLSGSCRVSPSFKPGYIKLSVIIDAEVLTMGGFGSEKSLGQDSPFFLQCVTFDGLNTLGALEFKDIVTVKLQCFAESLQSIAAKEFGKASH